MGKNEQNFKCCDQGEQNDQSGQVKKSIRLLGHFKHSTLGFI